MSRRKTKATMTTTPEVKALSSGDLYVLAYAHHMAKTSQSEAARQMYEAYMEHERKWLQANSRVQRPVASGTPNACHRTPRVEQERGYP